MWQENNNPRHVVFNKKNQEPHTLFSTFMSSVNATRQRLFSNNNRFTADTYHKGVTGGINIMVKDKTDPTS